MSVLEPLASAGLAITLAYLALERFRYRRDVEHSAQPLYEIYAADKNLEARADMEHVNELGWLCRKHSNGFVPRGFHATIYAMLFRNHGDVFLITGLATVSAIVLIVGIAGQADILGQVTARWMITVCFWVCIFAMISPAIFVLGGRRCCRWGKVRTAACDKQIAYVLSTLAKRAALAPEHPDSAEKLEPHVPKPRRFFGIFGPART